MVSNDDVLTPGPMSTPPPVLMSTDEVSARTGDVVLTRLEASRHRVTRSRGAARTDDIGYLRIVAPSEGCAGVEQKGRQAWVMPGEWCAFRAKVGLSPTEYRRERQGA